MSTTLPAPSENQAYWDVSAIEGGILKLPLKLFLEDYKTKPDFVLAPSLAFVLKPQNSKQPDVTFLFDLGIRKDLASYPPRVAELIAAHFNTVVEKDVADKLVEGGLDLKDVNYVAVSHSHWDHVGNPKDYPNARFLIGGASVELFGANAYPSQPNVEFASDLWPPEQTSFLDTSGDDWKPIGPFPKALDFFNDGSLYIIDTPGHLPGHINLLARTSNDGAWIYLAGDSAHHWRLITGESKIAEGTAVGCMHLDKPAAELTQARIKQLTEMPRVRVLLGHDEPWYRQNIDKGVFWPGKITSL